ncbi:MAG TPA: DUF3347 domain-containing protein, partial [Pirellulales bacterium]|nr:DUF3347 domain-containing protein [Pirellulales bacterium]
ESAPGVFEIRPVTVGPILRDKIVILEGLKAGEQVATAGNFLIDSQMQLAGKPSLIDPARAVAKVKQRNEPLKFEHIAVAAVAGETGKTLEDLYAAYFEVQQALASDKKPPAAIARRLHETATSLAGDRAMPASSVKLMKEVAAGAEHLHHMDIEEARKAFKPISHAIVTLATQVRSAGSLTSFTHFFCPMVPGGAGDWLQPNDKLLNPYFGSKMLRCGEKVQALPPAKESNTESDPHKVHRATSASKGDA